MKSLRDVETQLMRYRETGNDALLDAVGTYFAENTPASPQGRLLHVWHAQAAHDFTLASRILAPALQGNNIDAWLLAANLQRVMGNSSAAETACQRVSDTAPLQGQLCLLQVRVHRGDKPDPAQLSELQRLYKWMHQNRSLTHEQHAWIMGIFTEAHLALNEPLKSRHWSAQAYATSPTVQNRAAHASQLLLTGEADEVLRLIDTSETAPALVVLRLRALQRLGQLDSVAATVNQVDRQFRHDIAHNDLLHAREMAVFYLDILPDQALAEHLARKNWALQKELEDRRLLERVEG
ncbi:MAG: hypothetical protein AAF993_00155 [Pseudomonadota bacterium]